MILLDTNVISAVMAPAPPRPFLDWLNHQETVRLYLSAITLAEIGYGLRVLPDGRRRRDLENRFTKFVAHGFEQRILSFDKRAAFLYGEIMGHRRELGRPLGILDGQIASIARAHRLAVATRNTRDFEDCGIELVNPFDA
ncbi:MAG: type II toxin-antitoxin system VapC family toxin [Thermoanaerobaculia bacterium]